MADKDKPLICWDSCCFITLFTNYPGQVDGCRRVIEAAQRGELTLLASFLSMAESAQHQGIRPPLGLPKLATIQAFFENDFITWALVDRRVAEAAQQQLRTFGGIKGADAVILATAVVWKAAELHTFDKDILALNGRIPSLTICEADWTTQAALPSAPPLL